MWTWTWRRKFWPSPPFRNRTPVFLLLALIKPSRFKVLMLFLRELLCVHSKESECSRAVKVWQSNSWSCHADGKDSGDPDISADDTSDDVLSDGLRLLYFFGGDVDHDFGDGIVWMWAMMSTFRSKCSRFLSVPPCPIDSGAVRFRSALSCIKNYL
jgi:hypothetical protein